MTQGPMRRQKFSFVIASMGLSEITRRIGVDQAPPLPLNDALRLIGKPVPRSNGRAKVTGAATFTVDVKLPGMLHARLLRSPLPHAHIRAIDTRAAE